MHVHNRVSSFTFLWVILQTDLTILMPTFLSVSMVVTLPLGASGSNQRLLTENAGAGAPSPRIPVAFVKGFPEITPIINRINDPSRLPVGSLMN